MGNIISKEFETGSNLASRLITPLTRQEHVLTNSVGEYSSCYYLLFLFLILASDFFCGREIITLEAMSANARHLVARTIQIRSEQQLFDEMLARKPAPDKTCRAPVTTCHRWRLMVCFLIF
ncbi:hypothetical protein KFK09_024165 [Dendrobium nobile]|uniref:Uncharacterized protein n=1 Tax=Dendrobium nobile TaxID=94219 RepID=A0A8T3ADC5_DENNO|nr:hypothetical protein KFK09_024165 [Dendrobium nobile]